MAHEPLTPGRKRRDKVMTFLRLRRRAPQPPGPSINSAETDSLNTPLQRIQLENDAKPTVLPSIQPRKVFSKGKSYKKDMAILSIAYILQEIPELKTLIHLLVEIRDKDSEGHLTAVLETCARFSVRLASATDAHRAEATQAITSFIETVEKIKTVELHGDVRSFDEMKSMISKDIERIKPSSIGNADIGESLPNVLDITIGSTISIFSVVKEASSVIPVPWVQPLIGTVVSMLQMVSQTRSNYSDMRQIAATAGDFVISCAVIHSEKSDMGPILERALKKFHIALRSIAEECNELSHLNPFSRYLQQSVHMNDLRAIRQRLNDAIQLFQTENSIDIKLNIEELDQKIDFASLSNLPSHPRYTRNDYFEKSRDDVLQDLSNWIANGSESVLWMHGAAGLGKSTVAQELVHLLKSEDRLAGGVLLTTLTDEPPERAIQMISRQLGQMYPRTIPNIAEAARKFDGPHDKLREYFTAYIFNPIRALEYPYQLVCVIDALDEWQNYESFLAQLVHLPLPSPVKFVLTSRFNYSIERAVNKMPTRKYPLPLASQTVIENYFHHHFLSGDIDWKGRRPYDEIIRRLAALAGGLLIWAATVRLVVMNPFDARDPHVILDQILTSEESLVGHTDGHQDGQLERLYHSAISTHFPPNIRGMLRKFLAATIVLQEALPVVDFAHLTGIPVRTTEEIHQRLAALQTQGDPKTDLISPATQRFHASFIEFITTESNEQTFQAITAPEAHCIMGNRCLEIVFVELLPSFRGTTCVYSELRGVEVYAVKFWPLHVSSGTTSQPSAPPLPARVTMDLISEAAMRRWAILFLPCIATRFQNGHEPLDNIERSGVLYEIATIIGDKDSATLTYCVHCLKISTQLQPQNFETWAALGDAYEKLYNQSLSQRDLDEAINAFRDGLKTAPHPDSDRSTTTLNNLALALRTRFGRQGSPIDLDDAISLHREALSLCPPHQPNHSKSLNNVAISLQIRFTQWGSLIDLDEAISLHRDALCLRPAPHPQRSNSLNNFANAHYTRFEQRGSQNDLDEAIILHREALSLRPELHPNRPNSLSNLAIALNTRFGQRGSPIDLAEGIALHTEALSLRPAPDPDRSMSLVNLSWVLNTSFEYNGSLIDLEKAISLNREALSLRPASHPDRSNTLNNLAITLRNRSELLGSSIDLDEAFSLQTEALQLCPAPHPNRSEFLNEFAIILRARFAGRGASSDLDEAISFHRESLLLFPPTRIYYSKRLRNMAITLRARYDHGHLLQDLTETISLYKKLLDCPAEDHNRSWALEKLPAAIIEHDALIGNSSGDVVEFPESNAETVGSAAH